MIKRIELGSGVIASLSERTIGESLALDAWPADPPVQFDRSIADTCRQIVYYLRSGPGAVVVGLVTGALGDADLGAVAWNLFTSFARPIPQYDTGELIYPVQVADNAPAVSHYSQSRQAGGFHTDGTLLPRPPDIAALVCVSQASSGGATVLIDGQLLCSELGAVKPDAVTVLQAPHHFDALGQVPGLATKQQPILDWSDGHVRVRYLRQYIEDGYRRIGEPVPAELDSAMDALDTASGQERYQAEVLLRRGQLLIWDNNRFLHGRRAFDEDGSRRRLLRIYGTLRPDFAEPPNPLRDGLYFN
jgi:alpha-ketoglutarate-dependent taurine dioxygenase